MSVSVLLYCYKNEIYLEHCLITLANQSLKDFELIVLNDGDNAVNQKKIIHYYPNAQIISFRQPVGMIEAFAIGILSASHRFCVFHRGWDYSESDRLRFQVELLKQTGSMVSLVFPRFLRSTGLDNSSNSISESVRDLSKKAYNRVELREVIPIAWLSNWMFDRTLIPLERVTQFIDRSRETNSRVPRNYAEETLQTLIVQEKFLVCNRTLVTLNERDDLSFFESKKWEGMAEYNQPESQ